MADGIKTDYDRIKAMDIFEFWPYYELWRKKMDREIEVLKAQSKTK